MRLLSYQRQSRQRAIGKLKFPPAQNSYLLLSLCGRARLCLCRTVVPKGSAVRSVDDTDMDKEHWRYSNW